MTTDTTSTVPVHTTPGQPETRQESGSLTAAATSPSDDPEVIRTARAAGIGSPPGADTPTEIVSAWRHGPGPAPAISPISPPHCPTSRSCPPAGSTPRISRRTTTPAPSRSG